MAIKGGKFFFEKQPDLQSAVRRFFEILDMKECSSNDVMFHPVQMDVSSGGAVVFRSVRVVRTAELGQLFEEMKEMSSYVG